jgi:hypothetical protein
MTATRLTAAFMMAFATHFNPAVAVPLATHITFEGVVTQRTDWISIPPVITPLNNAYRFELDFVFDPMKDFSTAPSHAAGQYNITAESSPWTFMNSFLSHLGFTVQPTGTESVSGVNVNLYRSDYPQTFFNVASTAMFPSGDPFTYFGAQLLLDDLTAPVSAESARRPWTEAEFTSLLSAAFQNASPFGLYMHVNDRTILDGSVRISELSIVPVPEASTWMMMIVGLCLVCMTGARQRVLARSTIQPPQPSGVHSEEW